MGQQWQAPANGLGFLLREQHADLERELQGECSSPPCLPRQQQTRVRHLAPIG
jgi:hypothetical protein